MSFNSAQTSSGQKFFKHLYFTSGNAPSYETVMQSLDNDISPVFGSGAKAITPSSLSDQEIKKGYFTQSNVSGVKLPLASRNPVFFKSNISIKSSDGSNIEVIAKNVPLASFDNFKAGTPPSLSSSFVGSVDYQTSVAFSGTVNKSTIIGSLTDNDPIYIILAKKDDNTIACLLVVAGNEGNIDSSYTMFRKIGFCYSCNLTDIVPFVISDGAFIPGTHSGLNLSLSLSDFGNGAQSPAFHLKNLNSIIRETCLITLRTSNIYTSDGSQGTISVNNNTYFTYEYPVTSSAAYTQNNNVIRIPMIYSNSGFYTAASSLSVQTFSMILVKIEFGGLL